MTEQPANNVVEVQDLVKVFRDFWRRPKVRAVDGLNLEVREGEIFGLLGPNGSGKSTTLKMILGLLHPSAGSIQVLGEKPSDVTTKHLIGFLPEESYLYRYLTPREALHFYARLFGLPAHVVRTRTEELLVMVGLKEAADRPVGEFSKGMARRLGLAQALINDPQLIILDEPTSGLDPIGCRQVKDLMLSLVRQGRTIILSSHLLADVEDVCDRIAILANGKIRAQGRVKELLEQQDTTRIRVPSLPEPEMQSLLDVLRERTKEEPYFDHPSMNLEQFFLHVIRQGDGSASDGAPGHGVALAPYLAALRRDRGSEKQAPRYEGEGKAGSNQ